MKLARYGDPGAEKPALVDADGGLRDLSGHVLDITGATLAPETMAKLAALNPADLPKVDGDVRLGPPVGDVRNFFGIGLNFADHAAETGLRIPREPVIFNKLSNCMVGPNDDVMMPKVCKKLDWEVELAFVVNRRARYVDEADAADYVAGYTICNDVSERHYQTERSGQWVKGKSAETFGPLGPYLVTPDSVSDIENLGMWLDVNGERRQTGSTSTMVFKIPYMLSYMSQFLVLEAGDVITTGTPPGVALGMEDPAWLQAGDVMTLGIDELGKQRQTVVAFKG